MVKCMEIKLCSTSRGDTAHTINPKYETIVTETLSFRCQHPLNFVRVCLLLLFSLFSFRLLKKIGSIVILYNEKRPLQC